MSGDRIQRAAAAYLAAQGVLCLTWWAALCAAPSLRPHFFGSTRAEGSFREFLAPDIVVFAGGSLLAAALLWRRHRLGRAALFLHAGGAAYAGLLTIAHSVVTGEARLGAAIMAICMIALGAFLWLLRPRAPDGSP